MRMWELAASSKFLKLVKTLGSMQNCQQPAPKQILISTKFCKRFKTRTWLAIHVGSMQFRLL